GGNGSSGKSSGKMSTTTAKLLAVIRKRPEITIPELAAKSGRTERTIERLVRQLRENEIIGRVGPAKGGHWEILE
ncbi:MAG: winged helix-turn-helix transcriptional regulator, partial [Planctomyces sp.]